MTNVEQAQYTPEMLVELDYELTASVRGMTLLEALYDERKAWMTPLHDAAPEMLEALQEIANLKPTSSMYGREQDLARAVIAKATGGAVMTEVCRFCEEQPATTTINGKLACKGCHDHFWQGEYNEWMAEVAMAEEAYARFVLGIEPFASVDHTRLPSEGQKNE